MRKLLLGPVWNTPPVCCILVLEAKKCLVVVVVCYEEGAQGGRQLQDADGLCSAHPLRVSHTATFYFRFHSHYQFDVFLRA